MSKKDSVRRTAVMAVPPTVVFKQPALVFAITTYQSMAREVVAAAGGHLELGVAERKTFRDGRTWFRYATPLEDREVVIIGGTMTDDELVQLYKMGYHAQQCGARKLTIVIPYHGDARQDRKQQYQEMVDGMLSSKLIASIPGSKRVLLVDIHADSIIGFFSEGGIICENIEVLKPLIGEIAREQFGGDCVPLAPDEGRAKVVGKAAKANKLPFAVCPKLRDGMSVENFGKTETFGLIGDVKGRSLIVSDDIGNSFSTAGDAAQIALNAGAKEAVLLITHGATTAGFVSKIKARGVFSAIYVTDSLPRVHRLAKQFPGFVNKISLAPHLVPYLVPNMKR